MNTVTAPLVLRRPGGGCGAAARDALGEARDRRQTRRNYVYNDSTIAASAVRNRSFQIEGPRQELLLSTKFGMVGIPSIE